MSALWWFNFLSVGIIFLGCVNVSFLNNGMRRGPWWRRAAYELHRLGYAGLGAFAFWLGWVMLTTNALPLPQSTGVFFCLAIVFLSRALRTIFGGGLCRR